jgi:hypothetical protein
MNGKSAVLESNVWIVMDWGKCLRAWDWVADQTLDKRLKKSDYINLIERKHGYVLRKEG